MTIQRMVSFKNNNFFIQISIPKIREAATQRQIAASKRFIAKETKAKVTLVKLINQKLIKILQAKMLRLQEEACDRKGRKSISVHWTN